MKKLINPDLLRIMMSVLLFLISFFIKENFYHLLLLVISYIIVGYEIYQNAWQSIKKKEIFDENLLMIIATIGAFFIGSYEEAVMVMLLYEIGEYFSDLAVAKSKESITELLDLRVDYIHIMEKDKMIDKKSEEAKVGDIFIVKPGEKIPLDGIIIEGSSYLDTASITGESTPRKKEKNDTVLSGCLNKNSILKIKATKTYQNSTANKMILFLEEASKKEAKTETFIRKFAKIYTPIVVLSAILMVIIPMLFGQDSSTWIYRALVFLVTSCPCALVIAVPLGYFCGIGKASKEGILMKGSNELEKLTEVNYLLLDKTGTITEGVFEVEKIVSKKLKEEQFLKILASAEKYSNHPIADAIQKKYQKKEIKNVTNYKEISGKGISCKIGKDCILIGNESLLKEQGIVVEKPKEVGTIIHLAINQEYQGYVIIADRIKKTSYQLKELKKLGINQLAILSGDEENIVKEVAKKTGMDTWYSNLLPEDKVKTVRKYQEQGKVMFVGDGINDAPVMKIADISVSMGNLGSDAAIEASDIVIMHDNLEKIKTAIEIAEITKQKVKISIIMALIVKFIVLALGVLGLSTIWMAVFADVGVTFLAILYVLTIFLKK